MMLHAVPRHVARRWLTTTVAKPVPTVTHDVLNQAAALPDDNGYSKDPAMLHATAWLPEASKAAIEAFGRASGSRATAELCTLAHTHTPVLQQYDRFGNRVDVVKFHDAYHTLMQQAITAEVPSYAWRHEQDSGAHVVRAALSMLHYQAEPGTSCPITMTFAAVPALRTTPSVADTWVPRLTTAQYDPRNVPASEKTGATMGMSMTEKQGGSDVRANTTTATPLTDATGPGQQYALRGHKWFTSAPMCDAFLTLAHTPEGVSCFLVPRWLPDGTRNTGFRVTRLKDKLGDRSNASSEVEYDGAWGEMVGEPGRGVRTIVDMVVHTRLDCALGSAALMRQVTRLAAGHASHRSAFGHVLIEQPAMRTVLADLSLESEAAVHMVFAVANAFDTTARDPTNEAEQGFRRVATAVTKYWVCKRAPDLVYEAMECHGGNGYVEEWDLPRMYRQAPLNSIWEGSGNVICLDILRAMAKEPEAVAAFLARLHASRGADSRLDAHVAALTATMHDLRSATPADMQARCRSVVESMARCLQGVSLAEAGQPELLAAFCEARLQAGGAANYGGVVFDRAVTDTLVSRINVMHDDS